MLRSPVVVGFEAPFASAPAGLDGRQEALRTYVRNSIRQKRDQDVSGTTSTTTSISRSLGSGSAPRHHMAYGVSVGVCVVYVVDG
jgi:hypothetical protein